MQELCAFEVEEVSGAGIWKHLGELCGEAWHYFETRAKAGDIRAEEFNSITMG
ncbi:hypothetical protein [Massilia sp. DD77]|uniref:hypothetical protein n=1 Tax=Massilia sp. DD77 TaxID=3109349 RepID=UPI003000C4BA